MLRLDGQRILFISPCFFGYEQDIIRDFVARGAAVDFLPDRPFDSALLKACARFAPQLVAAGVNARYRRQLEAWGRSTYDLVFVINGQTLSQAILRELQGAFPRARFVLYMWDSFRNRKSTLRNLSFFNDALTFDPEGARDHGLRLRPLFYAPGFARPPAENFAYALSFIGTAHTDRYAIIARIAAGLPDPRQFYRYLYLQAPWVYYALRASRPSFHRAPRADFAFQPLARAEVLRVFFASRAIVDIEHPRQAGLTIRTLETLGASRKLVTTNPRIVEYDFFRPENICLIDRRAAHVPESFLATPYQPLAPELYHKYSLAGWTEDILGLPAKTPATRAAS